MGQKGYLAYLVVRERGGGTEEGWVWSDVWVYMG